MQAPEERVPHDRTLFLVTLALLLGGVAIVLDASFARALGSKALGEDAFYFFKRQALWALVACAGMAVAMRVPYWRLRSLWTVGIVLAGVLLVAVLIPGIGIERNGSRRWLGFGLVNFQPSELAKLALVVFLARYSELWRGRIAHFSKGFLPPVIAVFAIGGLVAKEDLGTAITVVATGLAMILMMGARPRHIAALVAIAALGAAILVIAEPYRIQRIQAWVDLVVRPVHVHDGPAYQPAQGLIALGSGGVWGLGVGKGVAKHLYLPAEHTDYIFATIGEETGLIGCSVLLFLFACLIVRGLTIAHRTHDWFGSLLAAGLTAMIGIQALLNMAVVTCLVPCTGVPLPFISYGGSSLVFTALAVGVIMNVSQYPGRTWSEAEQRERNTREGAADGWGHRRPYLSGT